ncbi:hydroxyacylglutathione hydrolase [Nostoc linckia z18]|uniref:Hydroxyacylglutathione hydrolase n=2 Tax=Nostoc linckia TaxID=92942 RepID=A0A9Q5ZDX3_NOSLI|nr:FAD/NAD(P)-binding protein [Nostoc linckia]PHK42066.1 hydroxyacylglutathione hydrolase [Nostoc linckia z15]PHK46490.1 hydroxyacylglutathione hydrolase [Nostoc linckia z16]PHJ66253.1 hydroxyacylglutathione hydrolase [Nostoc linckia z1]PHJ71621.1 hydroxyacylglutathione hydrolase [Nostoc linckia z3]PHJ77695.1 hydroxyacylglutathione hydrolase [Nostoc linckia z2]
MNNNNFNLTVSPVTIAIIGGGLSGSLVVANLLRNATVPLSIKLIERNSEVGRGVAYGTPVDCHLLNVPAGKMSAFADEPNHFLNWLHSNGHEQVTASTFVPRRVYGDYVQATLKAAQEKASVNVQLERIVDEAIAIETKFSSTIIYLSSGQCLDVQKAVLALGNFPAILPKPIASLNKQYVKDAWSSSAIADLNPEDAILLVGTGLTMADTVVALRQQGFQGKIHAVSRHGLMPCRHKSTTPYPAFIDVETAPKTARGLLHIVRQQLRSALLSSNHSSLTSPRVPASPCPRVKNGEHDINWRGVIDAIRPVTQQLWQALPLPEQKRFLRHVKAYWEVHRHRIAEEIAQVLDAAMESGQLIHYAGRIQSCQQLENGVDVKICQRGTHKDIVLRVNRIINCTGANCDYRRLQHPLVASLQEQRLIRANSLSMGIDTAANGALIDADGKASQMLYTLGTPRKGNLWETTAVPEIRLQAASLAQELLKSFNSHATAEERNLSFTLRKPVMLFRQLFDKESSTYTYLIADLETKTAILVDSVLEQVERDLKILQQLDLTLRYCLETHIHADHITGTDRLRSLTGCLGIVPENSAVTCADQYIGDGNILQLGSVQIRAIATPGHTNSHLAYLVNDTHLLTGDALFIGGCGRTDFQNGDAGALYDAVTQKLFALPEDTLVYPAHDYQGRTVSTIGEEKRWNPRFAGRTRNQFIEQMNNLNLPKPKKISEAVPANQQCGRVLLVLDYQI